MAKDFYAILGVPRSASESDIKQAYRKLSRELHPDKHKGDKAKEAQFKEVNEAYEVLSDTKKKSAYDQFGSADYANMGGQGGFGGFGGFDPSQFEGMGGFGDIFETFFSGQGGGSRRSRSSGKGRSIEVEMSISFEESVSGVEKSVGIRMKRACTECQGSGSAEGAKLVTCSDCGGTGSVTKMQRSLFGMMQQSVLCEKCGGSGKVPEKPCHSCKGEGRTEQERTVTIRVPAGIDNGQTLRLTDEGESGVRGEKNGDLLVHIRVEDSTKFLRDGDDIRMSLHISMIDATLGCDMDVETVQGTVSISIPAGTQSGQILRVKGKGMPVVNTHRHGDHYIEMIVDIPKKVTKEQAHLLSELKKAGL